MSSELDFAKQDFRLSEDGLWIIQEKSLSKENKNCCPCQGIACLHCNTNFTDIAQKLIEREDEMRMPEK